MDTKRSNGLKHFLSRVFDNIVVANFALSLIVLIETLSSTSTKSSTVKPVVDPTSGGLMVSVSRSLSSYSQFQFTFHREIPKFVRNFRSTFLIWEVGRELCNELRNKFVKFTANSRRSSLQSSN